MVWLSNQVLKCPKCATTGNPSNLRRHIKGKHDNDTLENFNESLKAKKAEINETVLHYCEECDHSCPSRAGILSHYRERHQKKSVVENPADITLFCSPSVNTGEPARKKFHAAPEKISSLEIVGKTCENQKTSSSCGGSESLRLKCVWEGCTFTTGTRTSLADHIQSLHDPTYELVTKVFETEHEFEVWLKQEKEERMTTFVKKACGGGEDEKKTEYYLCQHEGEYESRGNERLGHKSKKETGSNVCTAFLKVSISKDKKTYKAVGCFKHFGHSMNVALQEIGVTDLEAVKKLMTDGFTDKQIVSKLTKTYDTEHRLHYTVMEDVRNWRTKWQLFPGREDNDDLKSVLSIIENSTEKDGVRFFSAPTSPTGENFRLVIITPRQLEKMEKYSHRGIIVDDTHNVTKYHLKLSTILVVDGYDRGIPVGFLLSHSTTTDDVVYVFEAIKDIYPSFNPSHVMSDEAFVFYNAFAKTFPLSPAKKVLCRWHILRSWSKKAKAVLTKEVADKLMPKLSEMIREPVPSQLQHRVTEILHFLTNLDGGRGTEFMEYLKTYYLGRTEEWSTAGRDGIMAHTSMYAESWHSMLKKELLGSKKNVRIDTLLQVLYDGFEWVVDKNRTQIMRGFAKGIPRLVKNRKRCQTAKENYNLYLIVETDPEYSGELEFRVSKVRDLDLDPYRVVRKENCLCLENENTHCPCGACGYRYTCSCLSQEAGVACKHVHLVTIYLAKSIRNERFSDTVFDDFSTNDHNIQSSSNTVHRHSNFSSSRSRTPNILNDSPSQPSQAVDHSVQDQALKMFDNLRGATSEFETKMRKLIKSDAGAAIGQMEQVIRTLMPLLSNTPAIPIRSNASASLTAREVMNQHLSLRMEPRKSSRQSVPSSSSAPLVPRGDVSICAICLECDPPLFDDANPDELESRITLWKKCPVCEIPVHWTCAGGQKECSTCFATYVNYDA